MSGSSVPFGGKGVGGNNMKAEYFKSFKITCHWRKSNLIAADTLTPRF